MLANDPSLLSDMNLTQYSSRAAIVEELVARITNGNISLVRATKMGRERVIRDGDYL